MNLSFIVSLINNTASGASGIKRGLEGIRKKAAEVKSGFASGIAPAFSGKEFDNNLNKLDQRIGRAKSQLTGAAAMAAGILAPVFRASQFEEQFAEFASVAEISLDRRAEIEQRLIKQTAITGKSKSELLGIISTYVGKGMGLDDALEAVEATGRTASATYSDATDMAGAGFAVMDNLKVLPKNLQKAFEVMSASGKEGSFELKDMARKFPEITAGAAALKMKGVDAVASLSAALQIAMKSAGSADQAATNTANFMGKITSPDAVRKFKKFGINIEKELASATKNGVDPMFHMLSLIKKASNGGDQFKLGQMFADKQVLDFLRALIPNLEEYERIRDKAANATGGIDEDFIKSQSILKALWRGLVRELDNLLSSSSALMPIVKDMLITATGFVVALRSWTEANPELTAGIVKGTAALLAFSIAMRIGSFVYALLAKQLFSLIGLFFRFDDVGKNISIMSKALKGLGISLRFLSGGSLGILASGFGLIKAMAIAAGAAIAGFTAPIWIAIAAVAALGIAIYNYWSPISNFVSGFASEVGSELSSLISSITDFGAEIASSIASWGYEKTVDLASMLGISKADVDLAFGIAKNAISSFASWTVSTVTGIASSIGDWIADIFSMNEYSSVAEAEFKSAGERAAKAMINAIKNIPKKIVQLFKGLGSKIASAIGNVNWSSLVPDWANRFIGSDKKPINATPAAPAVYKSQGGPFATTTKPADSTAMGDLKDFLATTPVKQEVDAKINAEVIDKRPPNVTVNAPITIHEAKDARGTAAQVRNILGEAASDAKGGALHDGVDE